MQNTQTALQCGQKTACIDLKRFYSIVKVPIFQPDLRSGFILLSNYELIEMGAQIQWVESFVTDDKIYGVFIAENKDLVCQHALQSGFPANHISTIAAIIDPTTAEG